MGCGCAKNRNFLPKKYQKQEKKRKIPKLSIRSITKYYCKGCYRFLI